MLTLNDLNLRYLCELYCDAICENLLAMHLALIFFSHLATFSHIEAFSHLRVPHQCTNFFAPHNKLRQLQYMVLGCVAKTDNKVFFCFCIYSFVDVQNKLHLNIRTNLPPMCLFGESFRCLFVYGR